MALSRAQILECARYRESVEVQEWGGPVWVARLSGLQRAELNDVTRELLGEEGKLTQATSLQYLMELIVRSVVDDEGNPLFLSEDIPALKHKSDDALSKVGEVAMRLNGIGVEAENSIKKTSSIPDLKNGSVTSSQEASAG